MAKLAKRTRDLRRNQLDRKLARIDVAALEPPPGGWIRNLRDALGINGRQLAQRIGISRSYLSHMEDAEQSKAITMQTLMRAADGLDCELVYALVPKAGTLQVTLEQRAHAVAASLVDRVAGSMALEAQPTDVDSRKRLIDSTAEDLLRTFDKNLWDAPL